MIWRKFRVFLRNIRMETLGVDCGDMRFISFDMTWVRDKLIPEEMYSNRVVGETDLRPTGGIVTSW